MMKPQRRITYAYFKRALKQYEPMVQGLISRVGLGYTQSEEAKSQSRTELLKCMICYQNIGSFITLFYGRLLGAFRHMRDIEKRNRRIQTIPLEKIRDFPTGEYDIDIGMTVEECLGFLDEEEHYVVTELFFHHKTIKQISKNSGIAVSNLYRIKKRAIEKMKNKCVVG